MAIYSEEYRSIIGDRPIAPYKNTASYAPHEYDSSDIGALASQVNSLVALYDQAKISQQGFDLSPYEDKSFSLETFSEALGEVDNEWLKEELSTSNINSWREFEERKRYLNQYLSDQQQVAENFSTIGAIAWSLPLSLIDYDLLYGGALFKTAKAGFKATKLSNRARSVGAGAVTGGVIGAGSMAGYEATTGVYHDNSLITSFTLGALLGGGLGLVAGKEAKTQNFVDDNGAVVKREEALEVKKQALQQAQDELDEINEAIVVREGVKEQRTLTKGELKESVNADKTQAKTTAEELIDVLTRTYESARTKIGLINEESKFLRKTTAAFTKTFNALEKAITKMDKERTTVMEVRKDIGQLRKDKRLLETRIEALEPRLKRPDVKANKNIADRINNIRKDIASIDKKISKLNKKDTWNVDKENLLTTKKNEALKMNKENKGRSKKSKRLLINLKKARKARDKALKSKKEVKVDVEASEATLKLQEKLAKVDGHLSDEGLKKLLQDKKLLEEHILEIGENKLDLYGLRAEKTNFLKKLAKEIKDEADGIKTLEDFKKASGFKKLPEWLKKVVISPIENVLNSSNLAVAGFASMLHAGTLHRGAMDLHNAHNIKASLNEVLNKHQLNILSQYKQAVKNQSFKGSLEEFEVVVADEAFKVIGKMKRDAVKGIGGDVPIEKRHEIIADRMNNAQRKYSNESSKEVNKAVDELLDYYEGVHKYGNELGMGAFVRSLKKGYIPRHYDLETITRLGRETAIKRLTDAQISYARAVNNNVVDDVMVKEFEARATTAIDATINRTAKLKWASESYGIPHQKTSTSRLAQRSIEVFEDEVIDLLEKDVMGSSALYGLSMHGRLALKEKLGIDQLEELNTIMDALNPTPKERENLKVILDTILGTREMLKNPFDIKQRGIKALSSYSSMMHTLGFGLPSMTEISMTVAAFGHKSTLKNLLPSISRIGELYKNGSVSDKNTIGLVGEFGEALLGHRANRVDIADNLMAFSKAEEFIENTNRKFSIWGGLMPITDTLKLLTQSASIDFLAQATSRKLSKTDVMRLQDMGLELSDLPAIKKALDVAPDGTIRNMDSSKWGDIKVKMTDGIRTMMYRTILHPDGATLPKHMTDSDTGAWWSRIFMKFMRFPMESYERVGLRSIQEWDYKQAVGLTANIAMWSMILTAKDAMKAEDKQRYDFDDLETMTQLAMDSFLLNSWTTGATSIVDMVTGVTTGQQIVSGYPYQGSAPIRDLVNIHRGTPKINVYGNNIDIGTPLADTVNSMEWLQKFWKDD